MHVDLFATYKQQGYNQYPIFGSTADPAESSKGLGLATSLSQENIHKKQQCFSCATSTFSPFIRWGSSQDLVSTRRCFLSPCLTAYIALCWTLFWSISPLPILCFSIRRHCAGATPCSEEDFLLSGQWLNRDLRVSVRFTSQSWDRCLKIYCSQSFGCIPSSCGLQFLWKQGRHICSVDRNIPAYCQKNNQNPRKALGSKHNRANYCPYPWCVPFFSLSERMMQSIIPVASRRGCPVRRWWFKYRVMQDGHVWMQNVFKI